MNKSQWDERYATGSTAWDIGVHDFNLEQVVNDTPIEPCKTIDIGCGAGDNALWLASRGFTVTGVDIADIPIREAERKAAESGINTVFLVRDILTETIEGAPFGFVFDRGCFHGFDSDEERLLFARKTDAHLGQDGLWLSIIGSTEGPHRDTGPPQRSARDIAVAVEPYFEILSLSSNRFETKRSKPVRAWVCLMRKRDTLSDES